MSIVLIQQFDFFGRNIKINEIVNFKLSFNFTQESAEVTELSKPQRDYSTILFCYTLKEKLLNLHNCHIINF